MTSVAECLSRLNGEADAEYIVQACNAFPALLAALRRIAWEPIGPADASHREVLDAVTEIARAAVLLAEPAAAREVTTP
jgi:hypothetical protein